MIEFLDIFYKLILVFAGLGLFFSVLGGVLVAAGYNDSLGEKIVFRMAIFNMIAASISVLLYLVSKLG